MRKSLWAVLTLFIAGHASAACPEGYKERAAVRSVFDLNLYRDGKLVESHPHLTLERATEGGIIVGDTSFNFIDSTIKDNFGCLVGYMIFPGAADLRKSTIEMDVSVGSLTCTESPWKPGTIGSFQSNYSDTQSGALTLGSTLTLQSPVATVLKDHTVFNATVTVTLKELAPDKICF